MSDGPGEAPAVVTLVDVDEGTLARMVEAAVAGAAAADVTPPLTPGDQWTPERVDWLREFHRDRRDGLDGPAGEATWAIVAGDRVVGSVRLRHTEVPLILETGIWLTRPARGRGAGTAAMAEVVGRAGASGARILRADTTAGNVGALGILRRLGFELTPGEDGAGVAAHLTLGGS